MKIQKRINKLYFIIPLAVILVLAGGTTAYLLASRGNDQQSQKAEEISKQEVEAGNQAKNETVNSSDEAKSETPADKGDQGDSSAGQPGEKVAMSITASAQNAGTYQIRTLIQALIPGGTCTLQLTKGSSVVTKTAGVSLFAQTSTCQGFDVPVSELSTGTWSAKVTFEGDSKSGETTTDIEVR